MTASEPSPVLHVPKTIETAKLLGLTKQEEEEMRNQLKRNALGRCHDKVLEYVNCTREQGLNVTPCKPLVREMNECVKQFTRTEDMDALRREYLQKRIERRREVLQERIDKRKKYQELRQQHPTPPGSTVE